MANRLANATSPYLLQHAQNPVDWWEWGPEAFAEARRRHVPILLSVGYAACHWCHVMAHESFEDDGVAAVVNAGFVAVKVDREERPDIDSVYMAATTATTGHGGWPMTCLLTPDGAPFWCGTYLPREQFLHLLTAATDAWTTREADVLAGGERLVAALDQAQSTARHAAPVDVAVLDAAVPLLGREADPVHGGFGGAPKFPPSMVLEFLLRHHARTADEQAWAMAEQAAVAMARSGMYDQVGGGFARYAVDRAWVVPHFEKMLYDNAQLIRVYAHLWARAEGVTRVLAERVVRQSVGFLLRELLTEEGGFASSLDADTEGTEGTTYVWTPEQLREVLGTDDGSRAQRVFGVTTDGTFEHGSSTLQLPVAELDLSEDDSAQWLAGVGERLHDARRQRPQPARDDKVVSAWNGQAIAALADAGTLLDEPAWVAAAQRCADHLLRTHLVDGRLRRTSLGGRVSPAAALAEDLGGVAEGLVVLHAATAQGRWLDAAKHLLDDALARFGDGSGGFHDTGTGAEQLVLRPRSPTDNAEPGGTSALASALLLYGVAAGSSRHLTAAEDALRSVGGLAAAAPRFAGWTMAAAEALLSGPLAVAVSGGAGGRELAAVARSSAPPGTLVVHAGPGSEPVPLLVDRGDVDGQAAAYVCRGTVCGLPTTDPARLREDLQAHVIQ